MKNTQNRKSCTLAMYVVFKNVRHTAVYFTDSNVIVRENWIRKRRLNCIPLCPFYEQQLSISMRLLNISLPRNALVRMDSFQQSRASITGVSLPGKSGHEIRGLFRKEMNIFIRQIEKNIDVLFQYRMP